MKEEKIFKEKNTGEINISEEVVSIITALAAKEIPGISGMHNSLSTGIAEFLGKKNLSKGVKVNITDDEVVVDLYVIVKYGAKIPDVAWKVQEKVKSEVEKSTGLNVVSVNVHIEGIDVVSEAEKENVPKDYVVVDEDEIIAPDESNS